ncbi:hypothetical protein QTH90_09495 [Variovorax sp. J2P1-59]|uniref:hypothetical protein n=1 Tax=Variovorax flavidus TaxID=3053501 RepID=UPI002574EBA7|nr:hypothetical protein [Variovorax sp. J2P1-59]MDM0074613.1 hypothetical protein [Variovorax sp. J2P1-59]
MRAIMGAAPRQILRLLQAVAFARIQCECMRLTRAVGRAVGPERFEYHRRMDVYARELEFLQHALAPDERSAVRVERALFLRLLLSSAPWRLASWSDTETLDEMPASHLFEWVAHDDERMELAEIESAMTPQETMQYAYARIHLASQGSI